MPIAFLLVGQSGGGDWVKWLLQWNDWGVQNLLDIFVETVEELLLASSICIQSSWLTGTTVEVASSNE